MQPHTAFLFDISTSLSPGSIPPGPWLRVSLADAASSLWRRACAAIAGWRVERAALAALDEFDNRMLRDVGLTRCGITHAVRFGRTN